MDVLQTTMSKRQTVFIEDDWSGVERLRTPPRARTQNIRQRFPVKQAPEDTLVPVHSGSPWKHYQKQYPIRYWCSFAVVTSKSAPDKQFMIRSISGTNTEEQIQIIRRAFNQNVVQNMEVYTCTDSGYFVISEFMPTSVLHICRSPAYPTEAQLSSILYQVRSTLCLAKRP